MNLDTPYLAVSSFYDIIVPDIVKDYDIVGPDIVENYSIS